MVSLRCPDIGIVATGACTHSFVVRLSLSDGTVVQYAASWTVVAVTGK